MPHNQGFLFTNLAESSQGALSANYPQLALGLGLESLNIWMGSPSAFWTQTLIGAVIAVILQFLRATFTWFPIDPLWIMASAQITAPMMGFLSFTMGLVLKIILFKSLGPRRSAEYAIPIMTGLMIGQSLLYLASAIFFISTVGIPNLQAHWR